MSDKDRQGDVVEPLSVARGLLYAALLVFCLYISQFAGWEIYEQYWDYAHEGRALVWKQIISISVTLLFFVISSLALLYRLFIPRSNQIYVGNLVGNFVAMAFVIGLPLTIFILEPNAYRPHARDSDAKANLLSIYQACKSHWEDKGAGTVCDRYAIRLNGYVQSKNVLVELGDARGEFRATAKHARSDNLFVMNALGEIKKLN